MALLPKTLFTHENIRLCYTAYGLFSIQLLIHALPAWMMEVEMGRYDKLEVSVRLSIIGGSKGEKGTLGKGVVTLLQGIIDHGSLNQAAKGIGMAYSKAWRIMKEAEAEFGFQLIDRDGARGSTLTEDGQRLVSVYQTLEAELTEYANKRFFEELERQ